MSGSVEAHIGHVIDGNLSIPKKNCFCAFPMYWSVWNLIRHVTCESEMVGSFDSL